MVTLTDPPPVKRPPHRLAQRIRTPSPPSRSDSGSTQSSSLPYRSPLIAQPLDSPFPRNTARKGSGGARLYPSHDLEGEDEDASATSSHEGYDDLQLPLHSGIKLPLKYPSDTHLASGAPPLATEGRRRTESEKGMSSTSVLASVESAAATTARLRGMSVRMAAQGSARTEIEGDDSTPVPSSRIAESSRTARRSVKRPRRRALQEELLDPDSEDTESLSGSFADLNAGMFGEVDGGGGGGGDGDGYAAMPVSPTSRSVSQRRVVPFAARKSSGRKASAHHASGSEGFPEWDLSKLDVGEASAPWTSGKFGLASDTPPGSAPPLRVPTHPHEQASTSAPAALSSFARSRLAKHVIDADPMSRPSIRDEVSPAPSSAGQGGYRSGWTDETDGVDTDAEIATASATVISRVDRRGSAVRNSNQDGAVAAAAIVRNGIPPRMSSKTMQTQAPSVTARLSRSKAPPPPLQLVHSTRPFSGELAGGVNVDTDDADAADAADDASPELGTDEDFHPPFRPIPPTLMASSPRGSHYPVEQAPSPSASPASGKAPPPRRLRSASTSSRLAQPAATSSTSVLEGLNNGRGLDDWQESPSDVRGDSTKAAAADIAVDKAAAAQVDAELQSGGHYDLPVTRDSLLRQLAAEQARIDVGEAMYRMISAEELIEVKAELERLERRARDLRQRLVVKTRIRDAAVKLRKAHRRTSEHSRSIGPSPQPPRTAPGPTFPRPRTSSTNSILTRGRSQTSVASGTATGIVSRAEEQAERDAAAAAAHVDEVAKDLLTVTERCHALNNRLLEHQAAVLAERVTALEQAERRARERSAKQSALAEMRALATARKREAEGEERRRAEADKALHSQRAAELQEELRQLTAQLTSAKAELDTHRSRSVTQSSLVENLKSQLDSLRSQHDALNAKHEPARLELDARRAASTNDAVALRDAKSAQDKLASEVNRLQQALQASERDAQKAKDAQREVEAELDLLTHAHQLVEDELEPLRAAHREMEEEIGPLRAAHLKAEADLLTSRNAQRQAESDLLELRGSHESRSVAASAHHEGEMEAMRASHQAAQSEVAAARLGQQRAQSDLDSALGSQSRLETELEHARRACKAAQTEVEVLRSSFDKTREQIRAAEALAMTWRKAGEDAQAELEAARENVRKVDLAAQAERDAALAMHRKAQAEAEAAVERARIAEAAVVTARDASSHEARKDLDSALDRARVAEAALLAERSAATLAQRKAQDQVDVAVEKLRNAEVAAETERSAALQAQRQAQAKVDAAMERASVAEAALAGERDARARQVRSDVETARTSEATARAERDDALRAHRQAEEKAGAAEATILSLRNAAIAAQSEAAEVLKSERAAHHQAIVTVQETLRQEKDAHLATQSQLETHREQLGSLDSQSREAQMAIIAERALMREQADLFSAFERRLERTEETLGRLDRRLAAMLGKDEGREEMDTLLEMIKLGSSGKNGRMAKKTAGQGIDALLQNVETHIEDLGDELDRLNAREVGGDGDEDEGASSSLANKLAAATRELHRWRDEAQEAKVQLVELEEGRNPAHLAMKSQIVTLEQRLVELEARNAALTRDAAEGAKKITLTPARSREASTASAVAAIDEAKLSAAADHLVAELETAGSALADLVKLIPDKAEAPAKSDSPTTPAILSPSRFGSTASQLKSTGGTSSVRALAAAFQPQAESSSARPASVSRAGSRIPALAPAGKLPLNVPLPTIDTAKLKEQVRVAMAALDKAREASEKQATLRQALQEAAARAPAVEAVPLESPPPPPPPPIEKSNDRELRLEATIAELRSKLALASRRSMTARSSMSSHSAAGSSQHGGSGVASNALSVTEPSPPLPNNGDVRTTAPPHMMPSPTLIPLTPGIKRSRGRSPGALKVNVPMSLSSGPPSTAKGGVGASAGAGTSSTSPSPGQRSSPLPSPGLAPSSGGPRPRTIMLGMDTSGLLAHIRELERDLAASQGMRKQAERAMELEAKLQDVMLEHDTLKAEVQRKEAAEERQRAWMMDEMNTLQEALAATKTLLKQKGG